MYRRILNMLFFVLCFFCFVLPASAYTEERIIYIQEESQSILSTVFSMLLAVAWKEIVSTVVAFLCVSAMIIMAINHKKP